jgi:hypothetical protein
MNGFGGASGPHAAAALAGKGNTLAAHAVSTANTAAAKRTQGIFPIAQNEAATTP